MGKLWERESTKILELPRKGSGTGQSKCDFKDQIDIILS